MASNTYTVEKGDTLWDLAREFGTTVKNLLKLNPDIKDEDLIYTGQEIVVSGDAKSVPTNVSSKPNIIGFGVLANSDRTVYASWTWDKENTKEYQVKWYYRTNTIVGAVQGSIWIIGSETTVKHDSDESVIVSTYSAPDNATDVKFKVKPISETRTVNNKETAYWTAGWSTEKSYSFSANAPAVPPVPTVSVKGTKLSVELENLDKTIDSVSFEVIKNDSTVVATGDARVTAGRTASYSWEVLAGNSYRVRCRASSQTSRLQSDWSAYSGAVKTVPVAPSSITICRATSKTSVYLEWGAVGTATYYELEYTTEQRYFEGTESDQVTSISNIESTKYEKTGLASGDEYFFRVRSVNEQGSSEWSPIVSVIIGTDPAAPTTWSLTNSAVVGEDLYLYWVHNSEDGSSQTYAELELYADGKKRTYTIENPIDEETGELSTKTSSYLIDTNDYDDGTAIQWRVRTAGVTKVYGDWSVQRTVDIYAKPVVEVSVTDSNGGNLYTLTKLPFYISALAGPKTQIPMGYHVTIISNDVYETVNNVGDVSFVNRGDAVYSKYFDTSEKLLVIISAGDVNLENNVNYTVQVTAAMDSGLAAESKTKFDVAWADVQYEPNAEIGIDTESYYAFIRPYCETETGALVKDVTLSIYRREFDGSFTELMSGLENTNNTFITDPHPALDFARYRVVAIDNKTGSVSYCDITDYPVGGKAVIIQWDEKWTSMVSDSEDAFVEPLWAGSMLKLPYNIDVSDKNIADVALIEYIGRKHPVAYYGTQVGESSTWNVTIPKSDIDTLYTLRRLAKWMGDVYVREPSGSGYWATISVSFSQKHCDLTIPVTIEVTRVEGGA